jgi:hypothetical protein
MSSPHLTNRTPSLIQNNPLTLGTASTPLPRLITTNDMNRAREQNGALKNDSLGLSVKLILMRTSRIPTGRLRFHELAWVKWKRTRLDRLW